jgi:hypothetical protein
MANVKTCHLPCLTCGTRASACLVRREARQLWTGKHHPCLLTFPHVSRIHGRICGDHPINNVIIIITVNMLKHLLLLLSFLVLMTEQRSIGSRSSSTSFRSSGKSYGGHSKGHSGSYNGFSLPHGYTHSSFGSYHLTGYLLFSHAASHHVHSVASSSGPLMRLNCIGGSNDCQFLPDRVECYNLTADSSNSTSQWKCESKHENMTGLCFGNVIIRCDNVSTNATTTSDQNPDVLVVRQHCTMSYTIDRIKASNDTNSTETSDCSGTFYPEDDDDLTGLLIFSLIFVLLILLCVCLCHDIDNKSDATITEKRLSLKNQPKPEPTSVGS